MQDEALGREVMVRFREDPIYQFLWVVRLSLAVLFIGVGLVGGYLIGF